MTTDTLPALLQARAGVLTEIDDAQRRLHAIGQAIEEWMRSEGAQERVIAGWRITYKPPTIWAKDRLTPLLEAVPQEQLETSGAYQPEHQVTVPASWDMRKVLPLARYSAEAARIIESARSEGVAQLKIEEVR